MMAILSLWLVLWSAYSREAESLFGWYANPRLRAWSKTGLLWHRLMTEVVPSVAYALLPSVFLVLAAGPHLGRRIHRSTVVCCASMLLLICYIRNQAATDVEESLLRWIATNSPDSYLGFSALPVTGPWFEIVQVSWGWAAIAALILTPAMCMSRQNPYL